MIKIFIDFDHTIFKTEAYKLALFRALNRKVPRKLFNRAYETAIGTYEKGWKYTFDEHAKLISTHSVLTHEEIIKKFEKVNESANKLLYPETIPFLKWLKTLPVKTILLTFGSVNFQKKKIKYSGVIKYFDKVIYTQRHKHLINLGIQLGDTAIFINDNLQEFHALKKRYPKAIFLLLDSRIHKYKGMKNPFPVLHTLTQMKSHLVKKLEQVE